MDTTIIAWTEKNYYGNSAKNTLKKNKNKIENC